MSTQNNQDQGSSQLSPALIKAVAEKVYAMLLHDIKIEKERKRRAGLQRINKWRQ